MSGRVRQFNSTRSQHLLSSRGSMTASMTQLQRPEPVCLGCVNKRMAKQKRNKEDDKLTAERAKDKEELVALSKTANPAKTYQMQKKKQTSIYNATMVKRRQINKNREEEHQMKLRKLAEQADRTSQLQQKTRENNKKQQEMKYRQQLYLQCKDMQEVRKRAKTQVSHSEQDQPIFARVSDREEQRRKHAQELKEQIAAQKKQKFQAKQSEAVEQKKLLDFLDQDFKKFSEFNKQMKFSSENPEAYSDFQRTQAEKKTEIRQERQQKWQKVRESAQKQSLKNIMARQQELAKKQRYQQDLKEQMRLKKRERQSEKLSELREMRLTDNYCGDVLEKPVSMAECKQCHWVCQQKYIVTE